MKNLYKIEDELYIISDTENINENNYIVTTDNRLVQVSYLLSKDLEGAYKVVFTTNKLLIKDGVQAIDNEFLEWFVKNPSCEKVIVTNLYGDFNPIKYEYKIILPKEEPKQETLEEAANNYSSNKLSKLGFINGAKWQQERSYSEEDMFNFAKFCSDNHFLDDSDKNNICWRPIFKNSVRLTMKEMFEQFKKK